MNGFVDLYPLSSDGLYYYQITKPTEITNGNWGCKLKICESSGELIYHNSKTFAHSFNINEEQFDVVIWSKDNNVIAFYEFRYGEIYDFVIIFLNKGYCYRIDMRKENKIIDLISFVKNNNESEIDKEYSSFKKSNLLKDTFTGNLFGKEDWYPLI